MRLEKRFFLVILTTAIAVLSFYNHLQAQESPYRTKLDSGLTLILEEDHSAPVVSFQMWVNIGAADEGRDVAGGSHLLEHMLFKGTEKREVGQIAGEVEAAGGYINAYTSHDNTVYYLMVASRYFDRGLDILSDAIQNSSLDVKEVEREKEVVLEEIRMGEDSPRRVLYRKLLASAFTSHPYGRPVIGTRESVRGISRKKLHSFFKRWYVPSNMTLVVVGDFEREEALKEIKESFRGFDGRKIRRKGRSPEPDQREPRFLVTRMDINEAKLGIAYHIPELSHHDTYAIDILATILGNGRSSRLYRRLKEEERLVNTISTFALTPRDPGIFVVRGGLETDNIEKAIGAITEAIERVGHVGVSGKELARAKLSLESDFIYERETMNGRAGQIGFFDVVAGDMSFDRAYLEGIGDVTSDEIEGIVRTYLRPENMTITLILPKKSDRTIEMGDVVSIVHETIERERLDAMSGEGVEISRTVLENGITLIVKEERNNPTVAIYATLPGGLRFERSETNGLGNFISKMLTRGAGEMDATAFAEEVEGMAGGVSGFSGRNTFGISGKFLSRHFDRGMGLVADALLDPLFPTVEIEKVRKDVLSAIKREEDNLPRFAFKLLQRDLYRKHPYGMPLMGTSESVAAFNRNDMVSHYETIVVPERMVITVVGDVDRATAERRITELFGSLTRRADGLPELLVEASKEVVSSVGATRESAQVNIGIGFLGTTVKSGDRYPLEVLVEILSAQSGRLFTALRDEKSLAYSVSAFSRPGVERGLLGLYIGSAPEKQEAAVEGLLAELRKVMRDGVGEEELARAKGAIIGGYEIGLQKNSSQASEMANDELFTLGYDEFKRYPEKIERVTAEDVLKVARKYLDLKGYTISIVGPAAGG
ncbi:MAG: insulinase family protein [Deltaproteobacteria bacterium]|nr:insulinase family protein [Deltaproteobacteria bacterium]